MRLLETGKTEEGKMSLTLAILVKVCGINKASQSLWVFKV